MHIVILCPACGGGGSVANVALKHARELSNHFSQVTLVSDTFPKTGGCTFERARVSPRRFDFLRRFCHVPNEYSFVRSCLTYLKRLHAENAINFILCHGHAAAALVAGVMKQNCGIPFGLVAHGDIFDRPKGTYDRMLTAFYKYVTPLAYRNSDLVVALSPHMAECARKGGADARTIKIIPNGIELEDIGLDLSAHPDKVDVDALEILYVGRLSVEKGIDYLLGACKLLKDRGRKFRLRVIGDGTLRRDYQETSKHMGLENAITFIPWVSRKELGAYYEQSDVVCVPSINDPLPTVVLEALASGKPVVGTAVGGIPFMIQDGNNGLLVPPCDASALADALVKIETDHTLRAFLTGNALSSVFPRFSWEHVGRMLSEQILLVSP